MVASLLVSFTSTSVAADRFWLRAENPVYEEPR
jgi:hypothetical protein